jgi:hypothetical protein
MEDPTRLPALWLTALGPAWAPRRQFSNFPEVIAFLCFSYTATMWSVCSIRKTQSTVRWWWQTPTWTHHRLGSVFSVNCGTIQPLLVPKSVLSCPDKSPCTSLLQGLHVAQLEARSCREVRMGVAPAHGCSAMASVFSRKASTIYR